MIGVIKRVFSINRRRARGYVDANYYRAAYVDIGKVGVDPFQHFMSHGWREGRNPSSQFNTLFYRDKHLDGADINPLAHYLDIGRAAGLATKPASDEEFLAVQRPLVAPLFEPSYYLAQTGRSIDDPLTHYLSIGWRDGKSPNAHFDPTRYHSQHVFLKGLAVSPLYHFASQRRLQQGAKRRTAKSPALEVPSYKVRAVIEPEFDRSYYLRKQQDVASAKLDPLSHYVDHGWRESRDPNPLFGSSYYLAANADVADSGLNPF